MAIEGLLQRLNIVNTVLVNLLQQDKPSSIVDVAEYPIIKVISPATSTIASAKFGPGSVLQIPVPTFLIK